MVNVLKKYGAIGPVSSARPGAELRLCPWLPVEQMGLTLALLSLSLSLPLVRDKEKKEVYFKPIASSCDTQKRKNA
jgi:hypothetical protein